MKKQKNNPKTVWEHDGFRLIDSGNIPSNYVFEFKTEDSMGNACWLSVEDWKWKFYDSFKEYKAFEDIGRALANSLRNKQNDVS